MNFNVINEAVPLLTFLVAGLSQQKPGFNTMWDLWKTKWHWDKFY